MRELDPIRRLAPPVEPLAPQDVARIRARALGATRRRRRNLGAVLAPVVVAACAAVVVVLGSGADPEVPAPVAPAESGAGVPRLLLSGGWNVTRVDEWKAGSGEMTFARDGRELAVSWAPTAEVGVVAGAATKPGDRPERQVQVTGAQASVWRYHGSDAYTALWRDGDATVEAHGWAASADEFAAVVAGLERVDEAAWQRALPASAVSPAERPDTVDAMLEGLPRPPGLDVAGLRESPMTRERYQLGAQVAGAVACGWIAEWIGARAAGDDARAERAVAVLATSRDWPIVHELNAEGDYPEVLRQYADAVAGDSTVVGEKPNSVEESYRAALCT